MCGMCLVYVNLHIDIMLSYVLLLFIITIIDNMLCYIALH